MAQSKPNRLTRALSDIFRDHVLEEKWLLAPSTRVGFQWLDWVTRCTVPVLNVRVKTLPNLALELASPEMEKKGTGYIGGIQTEVMIEEIFARLKKNRAGYLSNLTPGPGLTQTIFRSIRDLRLSGLNSKNINAGDFEVETKGQEIKTLLAEYEKELGAHKLVDYADVLGIATDKIKNLPEGTLILMPKDLEDDLRGLERALRKAIPETACLILEVDQPGGTPEAETTDAALLRWIMKPTTAPPPKNDGTAKMLRAVGEVNEVREVLRRCVEDKIPFDEVEILHTDAATYVPLIYELASLIKPGDDDSIPATFTEGIPTRYSRPARALLAWVSWIRNEYPQSTLVHMVRDGLLEVERTEGVMSFARLAAILRAVPIGNGRDRYLDCIDREIAALEKNADRQARFSERIQGLKGLRSLARNLLACAPSSGADQRAILEGATAFLEKYARATNRFDEYSARRLLRAIAELRDCLEGYDASGLDVLQWLAELPHSTSVGGLGPRPGCIFVAPISAGGHSGRTHTFIVGLDDSRFPGAGLQDPVLLDNERGRISKELATASGRLARAAEDFARLLSRIRGNVTLGYCCRNLVDDREMFPSPVALSAYRILSGNREGAQDDLLKWLPEPASFAPNDPGRCIDPAEWWLWRMCTDPGVKDPKAAIANNFPRLARGGKACESRAGNRFTEYDGRVPEAGKDCDPTKPHGHVVSASRLETLGKCPMEYFFRYVLEIEPPEEYSIDPTVWLDPMEKGSLLHEAFREFMYKLCKKGLLPELGRDLKTLREVINQNLKAWQAKKPPPNLDVFEREKNELFLIARIFLMEEEEFCKNSRPLYFEAAIGLSPEGEGTPLDTKEPAKIKLPGGKSIRSRGRIDRVDEVPDSDEKLFSIWDYKTGSSWKYTQGPPFWQGRCIQNSLYLALARARLGEVHPGATIESFGYFFPSIREHGERILWTKKQLEDGGQVLENLCNMIANGCFAFTDDPADVNYSDYTKAFGDVDTAAGQIEKKLENEDNKALLPFQKLRGYKTQDE